MRANVRALRHSVTTSDSDAYIGEWVEEYNERRLHAGLGYLAPAEYYRGDPAARLTERQRKLVTGRERRRQINETRLGAAA